MAGILERIDERLERIEARLAKCGPFALGGEGDEGEAVTQRTSPLGRKRHCAFVRRLIAAGDPRGWRLGRKHFATPEAVSEELSRLGQAPASPANDGAASPAPETTYAAALRKALGADLKRS